MVGYIGTYTTKTSEGIYCFDTDVKLYGCVRNPKYLTFHKTYLAVVCEMDGKGSVALYKNGECVCSIAFEPTVSCHIASDGEFLYTANYHDGTVSQLSFENDNLNLVRTVHFQEKAGCHQVIIHGDILLVPCLNLDQLYFLDKQFNQIGYMDFPKGSGIRHGVLSDDGSVLYLVGELDNHLYVVDMKECTIVNRVPLLKKMVAQSGAAAIVRVGNKLYISVREVNQIAVFEVNGQSVSLLQNVSCLGDHPRDLTVVNNQLYVVNRFTNNLVIFKLKDGQVSNKINEMMVPEGIAVLVKEGNHE